MKQTEYYTPEPEEFHLGFECEYRDNPDKDDWSFVKVDADFMELVQFGIENQEPPYLYKNRFRVKNVVKEDFLALGFNRSVKEDVSLGKVETFTAIIGNDFSREKKTIVIKKIDNDFLFEIEVKKRFNFTRSEFWIELKNKSDLTRILKQLKLIK